MADAGSDAGRWVGVSTGGTGKERGVAFSDGWGRMAAEWRLSGGVRGRFWGENGAKRVGGCRPWGFGGRQRLQIPSKFSPCRISGVWGVNLCVRGAEYAQSVFLDALRRTGSLYAHTRTHA